MRPPGKRTNRLPPCGLEFERVVWRRGFRMIAGVDEVGRGALAGPVVAAAVILNPGRVPEGVDDSKRLTARQREDLYCRIQSTALAFATSAVDAPEIDRINILQATKAAMVRAVDGLHPGPDYLLIDAITIDRLPAAQQGIIHGDQLSQSIAAASIVAKVTRDLIMRKWHEEFPEYGWDHNVGYGTRIHLNALRRMGPSPLHRQTFAGVRPREGKLWDERI
ncbi:MAG: ribonuclease HII [Acidobacteria bacterium]|nr:ribonuclease HII [Acidobacteriota bacterium]